MRLTAGVLLSVSVGAAAAIDANVYLFQDGDLPNTSTPPTLSPEEARLVFAQRLGVSEYHGLGDASESTLSYINTFGGRPEPLFQGSSSDKAAELVLIVEGISSKTAEPLLSAWSSIRPAFTISNPPSTNSNLELANDLQAQIGPKSAACAIEAAINPFDKKCWSGKSKVIQIDLSSKSGPGIDGLKSIQERLISFAQNQEMNTIVVLMPEACRTTKSSAKPYGSYEMPQAQLGRRQVEEIMTEPGAAASPAPLAQAQQFDTSNSTNYTELLPVPAWCYSSLDLCNNGTNSCSGHGECRKKSSHVGVDCFTCFCTVTEDYFNQGNDPNQPSYRHIYWGGAACQKKDISGPFWLLASLTIVLVGLIGWAIGMIFSIGEEKLPGVIGAGVSSKAR